MALTQTVSIFPIIGTDWNGSRATVNQNIVNLASSLNSLVTYSGVNQINADWADVPYNANSFTFSTGNVGPVQSSNAISSGGTFPASYVATFKLTGSVMLLNVVLVWANVGTPGAYSEMRWTLPFAQANVKLRQLPTSSVGSTSVAMHVGTGTFRTSTAPSGGVCAVVVNPGTVTNNAPGGIAQAPFLSFQRMDSGFATSWPTTANAAFLVTAMLQIPVVPPVVTVSN